MIILDEPAPSDIRGATFQKDDQWYIMVSPYLSREQSNFTIAHELAEIELDTDEELTIDERHHMANLRASEILLPEEKFECLVHDLPLEELKNKFPHCSYEVIARRTLAFIPRVLTIFDNGDQTLRTGSPELQYPFMITETEQQCIRECYQRKRPCNITKDNLQLTAHYIDQNTSFIRVILFTEALELFD